MINSGPRRHAASSFPSPCLAPAGKARPFVAIDPDPGIPCPAGRRFLAPVQHRVPGGLPRRHQLPGLPQPRRRRAVRGGVHPVPRAEPGRRDVLLRVLGALRAGLPPRRHRPSARHPRHEAVPRGVARGLGHPRRDAPDHAARRRSRSSAPARPASRSPASSRSRATRCTVFDEPALRRRHDAGRRPAFRLPSEATRWTSAWSSGWASSSCSTPTSASTSRSTELQRDSTGSRSPPAP